MSQTKKPATTGMDMAAGQDMTAASVMADNRVVMSINLNLLAEPAGADSFGALVEDLISDEGGGAISNRATDKGGLTRWGISKRAHPDVDVVNLTRDGAIAIYREKYFDAARIAELPRVLAKLVFDAAVNHGVASAGFMLQMAYNAKASGNDKLKPDGVIGDKTIAAIAELSPLNVLRLLMLFCAERMKRYGSDATWQSNGNGWSNRLFENITQGLTAGANHAVMCDTATASA